MRGVIKPLLAALALTPAASAGAADEPKVDQKTQQPRPVEGPASPEPPSGPGTSGPGLEPRWEAPETTHGGETDQRRRAAPPSRATAARAASPYVALSTAEGEARLRVAGVEAVVRPGSVLGQDVVKSVAPGRIVLTRAARPEAGGEALVIINFDAQGKGRETVVWTKDPTARPPKEVQPR
jgi:hypothetical protein